TQAGSLPSGPDPDPARRGGFREERIGDLERAALQNTRRERESSREAVSVRLFGLFGRRKTTMKTSSLRRQRLLGWTRRDFAALLGFPVISLHGQGVATRNILPAPRAKPSGIPFHARFTDVAASAGLRESVVYGSMDRKPYILETIGC